MAKPSLSHSLLFLSFLALSHIAAGVSPTLSSTRSFLETAQDPCDLCEEIPTDRAQIARLQARIDELEQQIADLQTQAQDCQDTVTQLQGQLGTQQTQTAGLLRQTTLPELSSQLWLDLCPDLGQVIRPMRTDARNYLEETYAYLELDLPILILIEVIREKNLYCLGMENSFLQLRQSVSNAPASLWNLSLQNVAENQDFQWTLQQMSQIVQQLQTFVAIDPDDCQERLDSYLEDVMEYYTNMNERMSENMQAWLSTYQTELELAVAGMPYCANTSYNDLAQVIAFARVPS